MSGGSLEYFYYKFEEPLERISKEIKWGKNKWTAETLLEFQNAVNYLKLAQIYSHRVEWLFLAKTVSKNSLMSCALL